MPQFIKVATTDEPADDQAKLVEVEGQKIALFRVDRGFRCAGSRSFKSEMDWSLLQPGLNERSRWRPSYFQRV